MLLTDHLHKTVENDQHARGHQDEQRTQAPDLSLRRWFGQRPDVAQGDGRQQDALICVEGRRVGVRRCAEQAWSGQRGLTFCVAAVVQSQIPGVFMMFEHSTNAAMHMVPCRGGFANNRYGIMQAGWEIWGGALISLVLVGVGAAAWVFPGWWRRHGPERHRVVVRQRQTPTDGHAVGAWARPGWVLGFVLVMLPVALVGAWSAWHPQRLEAFDDHVEPANVHLTQLLMGEQLVPPPPLPPDVFLAADVVSAEPLLASADRRWEQMDANFEQVVLRVFQVMKTSHGYDMALLEGWRSPQRQALLAARGTSVTQAGPWQSYHQWGLAADCAFVRDGQLVISERDPWARQGYALFGKVAQQMGLTWGGSWQMSDLGHIEWRKAGVQSAMRSMVH
jgi:peptidoglycan L-alanyl-D-glutamate endopeptidase CwlK